MKCRMAISQWLLSRRIGAGKASVVNLCDSLSKMMPASHGFYAQVVGARDFGSGLVFSHPRLQWKEVGLKAERALQFIQPSAPMARFSSFCLRRILNAIRALTVGVIVKSLNLPNALTLSRIFIVPLLVVVLLTPFSEHWFGVPRHILGVALFLGAAFTDYLDGHIARRRRQVTSLGTLLDPIAP